MNRFIIMLLCGLILLSGCSYETPLQTGAGELSDAASQSRSESVGQTTVSEYQSTSETTVLPEPQVPHYQEIAAVKVDYEQTEVRQFIEAEDGIIGGGAEKTDSREGYSGSGCVFGIFGGGSVVLEAQIPAPQHYSITVRAASDTQASASFTVNGVSRGEFTVSGSGDFEAVRFDNIYLTKGTVQFGFTDFSADIYLDCILIEDSEDVLNLSYKTDGALSNRYSDESAKKLYGYLMSCYGSRVLSGQQCSQGSNSELDAVYELTGRYPAIRFGELMDYTVGGDTGDIELALDWAKSGGIVGYVWNWPMAGSVYQSRTAFDLEKAVTSLDIAAMEDGALAMRYDAGDISAETLAVIDGIDRVARQLLRLRDAGVAVIFRPLPEASSGQFWWSKSVESYLWLYRLIYERMTLYWDLGNLIWVWNGQNAEWYVGDSFADIISLDIYYPESEAPAQPSGINFMLAAAKISAEKPAAISECSDLPNPDSIAVDRAYWSFCSAWTGDYAVGGKYMQDSEWVQFYNSEIVIAKDEIEYNG